MNTDKIDIIYSTLFPWDHPYSSVSLSFTREFSRNNRVFYINHPISLKDFLTHFKDPAVQNRLGSLLKGQMRYEKIPGLPEEVIGVHPPMSLPVNWLPEGKIYNRLHNWNQQIFLNTVRRVIEDFGLKDFLYINCYDPFFCPVLPRDTGVKFNVYQCIDDISQDDYTSRHGLRLENEALRRADIGLVTSSRLYQLKSPFNPNLYVLNNAADIDLFYRVQAEEFPRPSELAGVTGPVIGYTGNLDTYRVDFALLEKIARAHQEKTLLLVGPLNAEKAQTAGLRQLPNVIFAGSKNIAQLPGYLQYMDCVLIPFLCNELTASIYPLKINEYLAAGKSVISTNFSKDIRSFSDHIRLVDSWEDFLAAIDPAITDNDPSSQQERVACARRNTWTARVEQFWQIVEENWKKESLAEYSK